MWPYRIKPRSGALINPNHPLSVGLKGWWLLGEGGGLPFDIVNNIQSTSITTGVTWNKGKFGTAAKFNGNSGDITIPSTHPAASVGPRITVSVWVRSPTMTTGNHMFVEKYPVNGSWAIFTQGGTLYWRGNASSNRTFVTTATAGLTDNQWHHVLVTDDGINGTLYVDGLRVAFGNDGSSVSGTANPIHFGNYDNAGYFHDGEMESVQIWNRPLSASEVSVLYARPFDNIIVPAPIYGIVASAAVAYNPAKSSQFFSFL